MSGLKHVCDYREEIIRETHFNAEGNMMSIRTSLAADVSLFLTSLRLGVLGLFPEGPAADLSFTFCGVCKQEKCKFC